MAQIQFDPQAVVQDAASAWSHVAPAVFVPTNDAEFDHLLAVIDQVVMLTEGDDNHPLSGLLEVITTIAHEYEQAHDPDA
jgi:HTH-type transcriptional regulator/antitoxin HigA